MIKLKELAQLKCPKAVLLPLVVHPLNLRLLNKLVLQLVPTKELDDINITIVSLLFLINTPRPFDSN
jgi:hypothetical protein